LSSRPNVNQRARIISVMAIGALVLLVSLLGAARAAAIPAPPLFPPGDIFVTDLNAFGPGAFGLSGGVIQVDPTTGVRTTVSENSSPAGDFPEFVDPYGLALESDGDIVVIGFFSGAGGNIFPAVVRVDPDTGARTKVSGNAKPGPDYSDPRGIAVEDSGDLLVTDVDTPGGSNAGRILRVDPVSGNTSIVSENTNPLGAPDLIDPWGVSVDASDQIIVADTNAFGAGLVLPGGIMSIDPVSGTRTPVSENNSPAGAPNFDNPGGLPIQVSGDIEVTDFGPSAAGGTGPGSVISVAPAGGARTLVTDSNSPVNPPPIEEPLDIDSDSFTGDLLVADAEAPSATGGVIRVDRTPGSVRTTLSENGNPAGTPEFVDPSGIAVVRTSLILKRFEAGDAVPFPGNDRRSRRVAGLGGFRYVIFEPARVTFEIERVARDGAKPFGTFTVNARKGRNATRLPAKIDGKALTAGVYRAVVTATTKTNSSIPASVGFRIPRRR
jgi:hypothetical protein